MSALTNAQQHSIDSSASSPSSPSALSISSRRNSSSSSASRQQQGAEEMMMFASPDYRKSLAMSVQSDAAVDVSGGHSARGSSVFVSDAPQYSNLLRDATWMIEQQHLQDGNVASSHNRVSHSSEDSQKASSVINKGSGEYVSSLSSTVTSSAGTTRYAINPSPSEAGPANAPTPSSSIKGTMTRSRSRRFSAPGSQYSGHGSISSISRSSVLSSSTYEPLATPSRMGGGDPAGSSTNPSSTLANSISSNQPQLQRDYRPGVVFEYYEGEWDWLPNFDEMRPDHVGIVGNFMIDDTTERDLFRPQVYTGPAGKRINGFGMDRHGPAEYQPRRPYKESGNFAVRFTTHMDIMQDGVYSFWLSSNDGSVLYISNTLVVENDGMHYSTEAEDIRMRNLLSEYGTDDDLSMMSERESACLSPTESRRSYGGFGQDWRQASSGHNQYQQSQQGQSSRHRVMSGDMGQMQLSTRELQVQMENAKTTIKDLEQTPFALIFERHVDQH
ncbi:hypothetical protein BG015_001693 [Linnemannia schmuckeri]|uniref:PA14 domain-containing protein n=1 Tax=Linnemannia schmuckeri TaxID=64567 RepID=A0A9P5V6N1_9FUNG|nr:hypothetical protein BG015_001693 [Linnemannia schmuckeri]